jgi:hypothetical protein
MFTEAAFKANKETNVMTKTEYEADNRERNSVTTQVNTHHVVPPEPQPGSSRTLHETALLLLPRFQATSEIGKTKPNVKNKNSEILTGAPKKD